MDSIISIGQTVFARWKDGYYYPAAVEEISECGLVHVSYLDGDTGTMFQGQIVDLEETFETMQLQGNWENHGVFYKGRLSTQEPMTMYYNDGDVEQVDLLQLRGARPGEPPVCKQVFHLALGGAIAGLAIYGAFKLLKKRG